MKRPVAGCGRGSPTTSRSALRSGAVTYALFALDSGNEEYLAAAKAQLATSGMSERRYSPLATLFAATFLFRIGNAVAALALPWFVLSRLQRARLGRAPAASNVIATIIGARGLVVASSIGSGARPSH